MTININELRRLAQAATLGPDGVSLSWVRLLRDFQQGASPAAVSELLDRLEAAEKERDWNAERLEDAVEELTALRAELETERMRLAACGVVALSNTPDSAKQARDMLPEYWSASCGDVARMVDENISLRARIEAMEKQEPVELNYIELMNSAQKIVESYVYFRRFIASTPLENDVAVWMADFVFAQLDAKGEEK